MLYCFSYCGSACRGPQEIFGTYAGTCPMAQGWTLEIRLSSPTGVSYHSKFGRSTSNHMGVSRGGGPKNGGRWAPPLNMDRVWPSRNTSLPTTVSTAHLVRRFVCKVWPFTSRLQGHSRSLERSRHRLIGDLWLPISVHSNYKGIVLVFRLCIYLPSCLFYGLTCSCLC